MTDSTILECLSSNESSTFEEVQLQLRACTTEIRAMGQDLFSARDEQITERLDKIHLLSQELMEQGEARITDLQEGPDPKRWEKIGTTIEEVFTALNGVVPFIAEPDSQYAASTTEEAELLEQRMRAYRKTAYEKLGRMIEGLNTLGIREKPPSNHREFFNDYLEAQVNVQNGCREPDILMSRDREIGEALWEASQEGEYACGRMVERNNRLQNLVVSLFQGKDSGLSKGVFRQLREYGVHSTFSPLFSAEINPDRTYLAGGTAFELLVPYKKQSKGVIGAELQAQIKFGFDHTNVTKGDLKTVEGVFFPVLFESGYSSDHFSFLGQFGAWPSASHLARAEQEVDPYSENLLENGHLRLGVKVYLGPIRLAAGYQRNPWGDSFYFEVGANIRGREKR